MTVSLDDLRQQARQRWDALQNSETVRILVGTATCGRSAGAMEALEAFRDALRQHGLDGRLIEVGCIGLCYAEPIACIAKPGRPAVYYGEVTPERARELVAAYLVADDPLPRYALGTVGDGRIEGIGPLLEAPVFRHQVRRTLRLCGAIDPTQIDHYLAHDGYQGLAAALEMGPERIIEEVRNSGLRGRGGAGFPTWRKWRFCRDAPGETKYLVCNADEGDPGAFMNRSLLEGDPHALLEGMLIAGHALGAREGYIYCRAEYPLALERLRLAIEQAEAYGLLGEDVLGSGIDFRIRIKEGAGAFVCGEETALIASLEGRRGMPRPRPPFPAVSGLWGKPTIINNVETLACVALILRNGAEWFAQYGTEKSKGTKTFALVGKVKRTGLVEVPLGITLRQMIFDIGGGTLDDKPFKAVQTGGPSGGCIPAELLDTPVDYDSLQAAGTIMGSGGMVVMDQDTCMVDFARYFLDFAQKESCGECVPCRLGTRQLLTILTDITNGHGKPDDIELLLELAGAIKLGALCGLGQTAPNPVLTTIRYFRHEYEAHIHRKRCPAVVCKELISSPCQHVCPIGTQVPVYISLIAQGRFQEAFDCILRDNPLPSVCARVCHHPCESKCQAGQWGDPVAVRALKRFAVDYALKTGIYPRKRSPATTTGEAEATQKVAIVGAGPAGLMAGYRLANRGYDVTILEALEAPGGALAACIPEYRLPRDRLNADIENVKAAGVKIRTNTRVGRDISFEEIRRSYRAVFLATGAHRSKKLGIGGEDAEGVLDAMEFLTRANLGREVSLGRRVGIVGGGNSAIDAARVAVRLNPCEEVTVIYRRTRAEMPAFEEEIEAAAEEGIRFRFRAAPEKVIVDGAGRVAGVECLRMELGEPDESGRRRPVPVAGSRFAIDLDTLIVAVGENPDLSFLGDGHGIEVSRWGTTVVSPDTLRTNVAEVFAGGDVVTGPDTVIQAMAAGKVAADMIDKYLRGESVARDFELIRPSTYLPAVELTEEEVEGARRPAMPSLPATERIGSFAEVELVLTAEMAIREARRCLRCDLQTDDARRHLAQCEAEGACHGG
ncbi:MAG: NADH-quinone oxidoreductase subunit NuoF [Pirellulales bacterium]|nr:NADH-quinone oxidoreductase subunit NuoF [Pirellulales bacterium]